MQLSCNQPPPRLVVLGDELKITLYLTLPPFFIWRSFQFTSNSCFAGALLIASAASAVQVAVTIRNAAGEEMGTNDNWVASEVGDAMSAVGEIAQLARYSQILAVGMNLSHFSSIGLA